jgi:hypothetical protein
MEDDTSAFTIEINLEGIRIIHSALDFSYKNWSGGDAQDQIDLEEVRRIFYKILLEHQFENS